MIQILIKNLRIVCRGTFRIFIKKPFETIKYIFNSGKYTEHKSYYPEYKQKSKLHIFLDQLCQIWKYGYPNEYYFSYGFDVKKNVEMNKYFHYAPFYVLRNRYNISNHSATAILRDKFYFGMFTSYLGINSGDNIALLSDKGAYLIKTQRWDNFENLCKNSSGSFFVKLINGECGCGIFTLCLQDNQITINGKVESTEKIKELIGRNTYLMQRTVVQHPIMANIHPQSINTIRMVTIKNIKSGVISVFPSILRIGCGESYVDNTSQGGVAVGINLETGQLYEDGFLKPQFGGKIKEHPDSNTKFSDVTIPFFNEAKQQAIYLHSMLSGVHSIGWDIAIGTGGPIFIEGNDNWEINGPQICNGPLKDKFIKSLIG